MSQAAAPNACTVALLSIETVALARDRWGHSGCRIDAVAFCAEPGGVVEAGRRVDVGAEDAQGQAFAAAAPERRWSKSTNGRISIHRSSTTSFAR